MPVSTSIQTINTNNTIQPIVNTTFKAQTLPVQNYPSDTVEIAGKKKNKRSLGAKIAIGVGATLAVLVGGMYAISKHQTNKLQRLYKENLIPKIFDKELTFTEAKTKEDALKYAKEVLGIKKIDDNMTLEALNYANKGITDVVNKNIGQEILMPRGYKFASEMTTENTLTAASVNGQIFSENFGVLSLNKDLFDEKFLTERLDESWGFRKFATSANKSAEFQPFDATLKIGELKDLLNKFEKNPESLTLIEKRKLFYGTSDDSIADNMLKLDWEKVVKDNEISLDINWNELKKLTPIQQKERISKILKNNNKKLSFELDLVPPMKPEETIYHEMGHLADYLKNIKNIENYKMTFKENLKHLFNINKYVETKVLLDHNKRWGTMDIETLSKYKNKIEKFKITFKDLWQFKHDKNIQKTAQKVSDYASSGIGEFIAEVYKMMISGKEIPEDVMKLYKKYNGPLPNAFK